MFKQVALTTLICLVSAGLFGGYFYHVGKEVGARVYPCRNVEVIVVDSLENSLISEADVLERLDRWLDTSCIDSIDLHTMEMMVSSFGEVSHAEVFKKDSTSLRIELSQRKPAVRFLSEGSSYYADSDGYLFPVYKATDVPLITGSVPTPPADSFKGYLTEKEQDWVRAAVNFALFVDSDSYWRRQIQQIDSTPGGDLVLYTNAGDEKIIFGPPTDIAEKFGKLKAYYKSIVPSKGAYKTVNLKYKNQIICN